MYRSVDKNQENQGRSIATKARNDQRQTSTFKFTDNRPQAIAQRKLQEMTNTNMHGESGKANIIQRSFIGSLAGKAIDVVISEIDALDNYTLSPSYDEVMALRNDANVEYESIAQVMDAIKEMRARKEEKQEAISEESNPEEDIIDITEGPSPSSDSKELVSLQNEEEKSAVRSMDFVRRDLLRTKEAGNLETSSREAKVNAKQAGSNDMLAFRVYRNLELIKNQDLPEVVNSIREIAGITDDKQYENLAELVIRDLALKHSGGGYCDHLSAATFLKLVEEGKNPIWMRYVPKSDDEYSIKGPKPNEKENYHRSVGLIGDQGKFTEVDSWVPDGGRIRVFESLDAFRKTYPDTMEILWQWEPSDQDFANAAQHEIELRLSSEAGRSDFAYNDDGVSEIDIPIWKVNKKG